MTAMDDSNVTTTPAPVSIGEGMAALAAAAPDRPAITCDDITVTRSEFEARTNRLARAYERLGVVPDSFVTIGLPNGIEMIEAAVATWKAGATPQPISHRMPAVERQAIIGLADPSLLVGVDPAEVGGAQPCRRAMRPDASISDAPPSRASRSR